MSKFNKDAFRLEGFIHKMLPLRARPRGEARKNDNNPADETREFDGVVYYPRTREVYCSFYNTKEKVAVLISVTELIFENKEVQIQVDNFRKRYYSS